MNTAMVEERTTGQPLSVKALITPLRRMAGLCALMAVLTACSEQEFILDGKRISVQPPVTVIASDAEAAAEGALLSEIAAFADASAVGLNAGHAGGNPSFDWPATESWRVSIGGAGSDLVELATPVVGAGKVVTVAPNGLVSAFSVTDGQPLWSVSIEEFSDDPLPGIGGGIALQGDKVIVHAGGHNLAVLSLDDGALVWSIESALPLRGGPTMIDDRGVVVTDLDGNISVWRFSTGEPVWGYDGIGSNTVLFGSPSPAYANGELLVAGVGGEIIYFDATDGTLLWTDSIASYNPRTPIEGLGDVRAHPVHDGGMIFTISQSGRMAAYSARNGLSVWSQSIGGIEMPWVSGKTVFVVALDGRLYALRRMDGAVRWVIEMPDALASGVVVSETPPRYVGPLVAGNQVMLFSKTGEFFTFDANTGAELSRQSLGTTVVTTPQLAGGRLFVLGNDGVLTAFQ